MGSRQVTQVLGIMAALLITLGFVWTTYFVTHPRQPQSDSPPLLYANQVQDDLGQALVHSIQNAKESIWLLVYTLTDARIIHALNNQASKGVAVHVIVDGKASAKVRTRLNSRIELLSRFGDGLMHIKILVIDQKQIWLGSANMTGDSLRMHGNLVMALDNASMAAYILEHAKSLTRDGISHSPRPETFTFGSQDAELWFLPNPHQAVHKLKDMIYAAKKTIQVAMFTWTRYDLAKALVDAHKRGVQVDITMDHYAGRGTGAAVVKILKEGGIPVRFSQGTALLHYKCMQIDGETLVNGSANWTKAAFTQNDDCFIVLSNLTDDQKKTLRDLWQILKRESRLAD